MEIKDINKDANWYASYIIGDQGKALIKCQSKKIEYLNKIIETINLKIEDNSTNKIEEIQDIISNIELVEHTEGYFKWIG